MKSEHLFNLECQLCDEGTVVVAVERKEMEFRKEKFTINQLYYKCQSCHEEYTTNELDTLTLKQLYNQYREKHKIPFPEEIVAIREKYGLNASKMAVTLGLGINSYANFEKGEIPSVSIANLIRSAAKPDVFKEYLMSSKEAFGEASFNKAFSRVDELINEEKRNLRETYEWAFKTEYYESPNSYNGFTKPNFEKITNLVAYYLSICNPNFNDKIKLNNLFFYSDLCNYQKHSQSMTGISYRIMDWSPAPTNYDCLVAVLKQENVIEAKVVDAGNGMAIELYQPRVEYNMNVFSEFEQEIISFIAEKFANRTSWDIIIDTRDNWKGQIESEGVLNYQDMVFNTLTQRSEKGCQEVL